MFMAPDCNILVMVMLQVCLALVWLLLGLLVLAALMYQANPDLSPFDIRNIMQETATYRESATTWLQMSPALKTLFPKNRQNNVYGHGQVEGSVPAVTGGSELRV